ncbi:MAG TPA: hypothetical protein VFQ91_11000 [Bryobacteraceae bacterium]|nr:hypothetical protein [Bryobacteraceae bacterium]
MPGAGALLAAVQVLVTVLDGDSGAPVSGLTAESFLSPVRVESAEVSNLPVAMLLAVDASAAGGVVKDAAAALAGQLRPRDRMAVWALGREAIVGQAFTAERSQALMAVSALEFAGDPHLLDGLAAALDMPFPAEGYRRVVVLVTAGIEGPNRVQENEVVEKAREKRIAIYPVYLHGSGRWTFPGIAARTGGAAFWLRERRPAETILETIRSPYLLTLASPAAGLKIKGREKTFVSSLPLLPE